jgi:phosphatidylserine/phosphatidylglycerophosphate/cardiolipin synthase-like enzyme
VPRTITLVFVLLLVASGLAVPAASAPDRSPTIVGVYPNPVADGDAGEYVTVESPPEESGWTITDGESNLSLPPTAADRVRYTSDPAVVRNRSAASPDVESDGSSDSAPTIGLNGSLSLANGGERLRLQRRGATRQTVGYSDAPEGERYERTDAGWTWRSPGATDFPVRTVDTGGVTAFALPDAPGPPIETLRNADRRIWLAGYTFTSSAVADVLIDAHEGGRSVRVLLEGEPVGGVSARQRQRLNRLVRAGVDVRVIGGPLARYRYHHAKYAVVDDQALVMSENWKAAGVGGNSSRGWGVVVDPPRTGSSAADALAEVFRADWVWRDAIPWRDHRETLSPVESAGPRANGTYPGRHPARTAPADRVQLLLAPENTRAGVVELIESAEKTLLIEQPTLGTPDGPFVRAAVAAAERGVEVRVLLDRSWYVREDNRALVEELNRRADARSIPLTAKLVEPRGRFEKIHAKGVVVDEQRVLVGSLNWNDNAVTENREVSLVVHSEGVAGYFTRVFEADWNAAERVPLGFTSLAGAVLLTVVIGLAWGLSFEREGSR